VSTATPDRDVVGLVPLRDDEYAVSLPPGQHRGHSGNPDPFRAAQTISEGLALRVSAGLGLLRATAGLGFRLVGLGRMPLALAAGPLGRAQQQARPERPPVAVRSLGQDLELGVDEVEAAFPHATDRLVVFVPGPDEDEYCWRKGSDVVGASYGSRLAALLDWTPVHVRADDSVPTGQAGVELSALLQQLVESWPLGVRRLVLIGHGTGGLVARAACGVRAPGERPWTDLVTELIALGTPHLVARPQRMTRELGRQLDEKLAGIVAADDAAVDVPPLDGVRYVLVNDQVTTNANPAGRFVGDLLWWRQRATLRPRRARDLFPTAERHEVSTAELPLVNHPDVHNALLVWLA
jgi:hypothetical protein